jgi:hypothetical protein
MEDAGFVQKFDFELIVRRSQFVGWANKPGIHDDIEVFEDEIWKGYHIDNETPSQDGIAIQWQMTQST